MSYDDVRENYCKSSQATLQPCFELQHVIGQKVEIERRHVFSTILARLGLCELRAAACTCAAVPAWSFDDTSQ
jgi:hypothetical protein